MKKNDFIGRCNLASTTTTKLDFVKFLKQQLNCSLKFAVDMMHDYHENEKSGQKIWNVLKQVNPENPIYLKYNAKGELEETRHYWNTDTLVSVKKFFRTKK